MIAMYGYNFCKATVTAVKLLTSNILRVTAVNVITKYVLLLGKIAIFVGCGIATYGWTMYDPRFQTGGENEVHGVTLTVVISCVVAYFISSYVFDVYDVAVQTILLCYCQDCSIKGHGGEKALLFRQDMHDALRDVTSEGISKDNAGKRGVDKFSTPVSKISGPVSRESDVV